ncbi:hypothetical protein, partial [Providencia rettgeri]|uniref:hypothetical protein n=1 Tax=Providencia rettgeri TaxID=587 RepID=UPI0005B55932
FFRQWLKYQKDEDDFINKILSDTAKAKYQQYFCAPMATGEHPRGQDPKEKYPEKFQGTKPWRLSLFAAKRRFISFDCDSFDSPKTYQALISYLQKRYKGLLYTTFNYTAEAPRCRFVLMSTRSFCGVVECGVYKPFISFLQIADQCLVSFRAIKTVTIKADESTFS